MPDQAEVEEAIYRLITYILEKAIKVAAVLKSHEIDEFELSCFIASYLARLRNKKLEEYCKLMDLADKMSKYFEMLQESE